jgi:hypothetical protein
MANFGGLFWSVSLLLDGRFASKGLGEASNVACGLCLSLTIRARSNRAQASAAELRHLEDSPVRQYHDGRLLGVWS